MKKIDITPQEVIKHLVNTGPLYDIKHNRVEFRTDGTFLITTRDGDKEVVSSARLIGCTEWYTKPQWTDNLSEESPVYCWVWDDDDSNKLKRDVSCVDDGAYLAEGFYWLHAEPVKLEDACIWEGQ